MRHGALQLTRRALATQCRRRSTTRRDAVRWSSTSTATAATAAVHRSTTTTTRQWSTPLAKTLADAIETTGPISIAAYMRQCLTSPQGGYYTTAARAPAAADQFGRAGDFITSPEISQVFGELCGVWFVTEWLAQGRPTGGVQLVEMGPGRGTLMSDMLRTVAQFEGFVRSVEGVWLVEASEGLRNKQKETLCGSGTAAAEMKELADGSGWECLSKGGIPVRWVEDIALLPKVQGQQKTPFIIAHEFFDALPIHAFESVAPSAEAEASTPALLDSPGQSGGPRRSSGSGSSSKIPQWRELLVSPTPWKPAYTSTQAEYEQASTKSRQEQPDFQLTLAKASTPNSLVLPERPRYQPLKAQIGSRVEISPESARYVQDFARRIGDSSSAAAGAALIIDYGPADTIPINSLRGIRSHKIISPFAVPGEADVSADVDFTALAAAALEASERVEVYGPVEQGAWLLQLGIKERAEQLMRRLQSDDDKQSKAKTEFESGWKRLVEGGPWGMGKAYKVMAVVPESGGKRRPVGFGGDVAS